MDPLTVLSLYDALGTKDHTEGVFLSEGLENALDLGEGELFSGLTAEAGEYLVGVVMVVTVVMASAFAMLIVIVVVMVVAVATAFAVLVVIVVVIVAVASAFAVLIVIVMVMFVVMATALAVLIVIVMVMFVAMASAFAVLIVIVMVMFVVMASAFAVLIVIVMVMLVAVASALAVLVVIVVVMFVAVATAFAVLIVIVMVMVVMLVLFLKLVKCILKAILLLHCGKNVLAVEVIPRSGNDGSGGVVLSDKLNSSLNLLCLGKIGMGEDDGGSVGDLIVVELAKVLHIHLTLINVGNRGEAIKLGVSGLNRLNSLDNVGELTYSAGLDDNSVGMEFVKHLNKCLGKIAYKRAADTTGVHLGDLDAGILKETAVNTYLAELVLDEDKLFTAVCLFNKLLYKCGLAGSEEAGKNIYFRHFQKYARGQTS